jgi:hypothetical protein
MGMFLLDSLPRLKKASNFLLDIYGQDLITFKQRLAILKQKQGLVLDYKEWWFWIWFWYKNKTLLHMHCGEKHEISFWYKTQISHIYKMEINIIKKEKKNLFILHAKGWYRRAAIILDGVKIVQI